METALVVLGLLACGLAGLAVWLGTARVRLEAQLAAARASLDASTRAEQDARAEVERLAAAERAAGTRLGELHSELATLREQLDAARKAHDAERGHLHERFHAELAALDQKWTLELDKQRKVSAEQLASVQRERESIKATLEQVEQRFRDVFGALAGQALKTNSDQFMAMAREKLDSTRSRVDELVAPIAETLRKTGEKLAVIEGAGTRLEAETGKLVRALREPHVRGRYGEIQLRRVAELAGMSAHCDFFEQEQTRAPDGTPLRPDMVVRMPNERCVVVDAKTNIQAYIDALSAPTPEEAERQLDRFARHVADQAAALGRKNYWSQYPGSPEFVVMYIPGDQFVDAALSRQPQLLERAAEQNVILASPTTLIGLLRAVAVGYREQQLARAAEELRDLGRQLHERVAAAMSHVAGVGKSLNQAVDRYNDFVGSYEHRLEPIMRRFEDSGVKSGKELPEVVVVQNRAKTPPPHDGPPSAGWLLPRPGAGPDDGSDPAPASV